MRTMQERHTRDRYTVAQKIQGFAILAKLVFYFFLAYGAYVFYDKFIAEDLAVPKIEEFEKAFKLSSVWVPTDLDDFEYWIIDDLDVVKEYIPNKNYHNYLIHEISVNVTYELTDDYYARLDFDVPAEQNRFKKLYSKGMEVKMKRWGHRIYEKRYIFQNGIRETVRVGTHAYGAKKGLEVLPEYKERFNGFQELDFKDSRDFKAGKKRFFYSGSFIKKNFQNVKLIY